MEEEAHVIHQRVCEEDKFVNNLIDLIPPRFFFDADTREIINAKKHKSLDEKLKKNKDFKRKNQGKNIKSLTKHKRAKLDPELHQTVTELQKELYGSKQTLPDNSFDKHDELKEKLKKKLTDLRGKRKTSDEIIERKRLKRRLSKLKLKNKRKKEKLKATDKENKNDEQIEKHQKEQSSTKKKQTFNSGGHVVFSKFDFPETEAKKKSKLTGRDYKSLLDKVEKEKNKINTLMVENPEKASSLKEKNLWMKALHKAEGVKLKDDPALLKRSLQKKEQMKTQRKKKWSQREKNVKEKMEARQKKRRENILARKKEKIKKKVKRAIKKGRFIPGFT